MRVMRAAAICGLAAMVSVAAGSAGAEAACPSPAPGPVADAIRDLFAALSSRDPAALRARLAPGFYAFEGGVRLDGMALPDLVGKAMDGGKAYRWSVTQPDVRVSCGLATIAYVNVGAVGDATGMTPVTWLESATLVFEDGRWRVAFLSSSRVPTVTAAVAAATAGAGAGARKGP